MKKTQFKGVAMLLLTAFIWGSAFVAQSVGMESLDAFSFSGIRSLLGAAVLLPVIIIIDMRNKKKYGAKPKEEHKKETKKLLLSGTILGVVLCAACNFQQFAFYDSTPGKIAFITAFYMFFVPLFGLVIHKKVPVITWCCVAVGTVGLYFLCIGREGISGINKGDLIALCCAVLYAIHILTVEKVSPDSDGIKLSFIQFAVSGIISCILMFIFESPTVSAIKSSAIPLLYAGILSSGCAYTFQIIGQKYTESTVASLIMCLESVFGVLCSAIVLSQRMTVDEYTGCAIMFAAIIASQIGEPLVQKIKKQKDAKPIS